MGRKSAFITSTSMTRLTRFKLRSTTTAPRRWARPFVMQNFAVLRSGLSLRVWVYPKTSEIPAEPVCDLGHPGQFAVVEELTPRKKTYVLIGEAVDAA
jgi:hypothetical protein